MAAKRRATLEGSLKEMIRRAINNSEIKGTEKLKWVLAGIKMVHLEKLSGDPQQGTGFADIDRDDEPEDDPGTDERGASDEHDGNGVAGDGGPRAA